MKFLLLSFIFFLSSLSFAEDVVVPMECKYNKGKKPSSALCVQFDPTLKVSVNGVCLYDDNGSSSSKSWKRGNLKLDKKSGKYTFTPKISCDNGVEYKLVPDYQNDSTLKQIAGSKGPWTGNAVYVAGKAPMNCYYNVTALGIPTGSKPCSGDSQDANYCRILENPKKGYNGKWWVHGKNSHVCRGGVAFGNNPSQVQDEEVIISDARFLELDEEPLRCIRSNNNQVACNQSACIQPGEQAGPGKKGCCRRLAKKSGGYGWYQNTKNINSSDANSTAGTTECTKLVAAKTLNNFVSDASGFLVDGGNLVSSTFADVVGKSDQKTGLAVKDNNIIFNVNHVGVASISNNGRMSINSTADSSYHLKVGGDVLATNFHTPSDKNLKTRIVRIDRPLDKISKLNGVYYYWDKNKAGTFYTEERQVGLIAQDVEKVLPELVKQREDGTKTVDYSHSVGLIVEAIKELKKENEALRRRIHILENN